VAIILLLAYISRLIIIALGAVLSPLIFLLWTLPKTADFAGMAIKGYFVAVFMVFINVVTIQLAGAFLTLPAQTNNSLISIAVAIGLLLTLLKTPDMMMQLVLASAKSGFIKKIGGQMMNVMSSSDGSTRAKTAEQFIKTHRKVANL
jgi:hypothetical protein